MIRSLTVLWVVVALVSVLAGAGVAAGVLPVVAWPSAAAGWGVAAVSSLIAIGVNFLAVGRSRTAFLGWGLGANLFRILTLVGIFAYMAFHHREGRSSFFITVFISFFMLTGVEVVALFRAQDRKSR